MTELRDIALALGSAGWAVHPLKPRSKQPRTAHGLLDATTDLDQIRRWWTECPNANPAVRPAEFVVVTDIDTRSGGSIEQLGDIPRTMVVETPGGGWHFYWTITFRGTAGKLQGATGIDIKGHSGYLLAPGAIHPNGGLYRLVDDSPIAPLPAHLVPRVKQHIRVTRVTTPRARTGDGSGLVRTVAQAQGGARNSLLFWAACCAYERGGDPQLLADLADAARGTGLDDLEIERTISSASKKAVSV